MKINSNVMLSIVVFLVGVAVLSIMYLIKKKEKVAGHVDGRMTMESLMDIVKYRLADISKDDDLYTVTRSDADFRAAFKRKARITNALNNCVYGIDSAKKIVQELIRQIIVEELPTEDDIMKVIDFHGRFLESNIKFEIILNHYKEQYGRDALDMIIRKYKWDALKYVIEDKSQGSYVVSATDVDVAYANEQIELTYDVQIDILTILLYQQYKGFGIVDTIREMNINGINCGTSGSVLYALNTKNADVPKATKSVWVQYKGKYIHFNFLNFKTEDEIRRITQLVSRYNNPGPLTEKRGYIVATMYDQSRVLALRPPASEYWAFFIRKFNVDNPELEALLDPSAFEFDSNGKVIAERKIFKNAQLAINTIAFLMRGRVTTAATGRQSSGKTTNMKAWIKYMDPTLTFRILEMVFEMYLREIYPQRNILSVQETEYITPNQLQDALKKSDAAISIVGEVATDSIAARMIQMGQVASIFTIFSHHATTTKNLVYALRNSLVNAGGFSDMRTAEKQVTDVVKVDVHFDFNERGERYVERITEIIQLDEKIPYPEYNPNDPINSMNKIQVEYFKRQTDRETFITRDIIRLNKKTMTYETAEMFSDELLEYMLKSMNKTKISEFKDFLKTNWDLGESNV